MLAITNESRQTNSATEKWETLDPTFSTTDIDSLKRLLLTHKDPKIRGKAASLLGLAFAKGIIVNSRTISELLQAWDKESNEGVKSEMLVSFWHITKKEQDPRIAEITINIIKTSVEETSVFTKIRALQVLNNLGGDRRIENELINIVNEKFSPSIFLQEELVKEAVYCLGKMKSKRAIPILTKKLLYLLRNPDDELYKKIRTECFGGDTPLPSFGEFLVGVYTSGLNKIGGEEVKEIVRPMLKSSNKKEKHQGAKILGNLGDTAAFPVLCEMVTQSENYQDRWMAVKYLSGLNDKRAIPTLKEALNDKYVDHMNPLNRPVAFAAYQALTKLGVKVEMRFPKEGKPPEYKVIE